MLLGCSHSFHHVFPAGLSQILRYRGGRSLLHSLITHPLAPRHLGHNQIGRIYPARGLHFLHQQLVRNVLELLRKLYEIHIRSLLHELTVDTQPQQTRTHNL